MVLRSNHTPNEMSVHRRPHRMARLGSPPLSAGLILNSRISGIIHKTARLWGGEAPVYPECAYPAHGRNWPPWRAGRRAARAVRRWLALADSARRLRLSGEHHWPLLCALERRMSVLISIPTGAPPALGTRTFRGSPLSLMIITMSNSGR